MCSVVCLAVSFVGLFGYVLGLRFVVFLMFDVRAFGCLRVGRVVLIFDSAGFTFGCVIVHIVCVLLLVSWVWVLVVCGYGIVFVCALRCLWFTLFGFWI